MTYTTTTETAEFNDKIVNAGTANVLPALKGQIIDDVKVVNNLDYKGKPKCGLLLTIGKTQLGLFLWDITNITLATFPEKNKPEFVKLDDVLHKAALANFGKKEEEFFTAIATEIKGKKAGCYAYPAQTQKGVSYQGYAFTITE